MRLVIVSNRLPFAAVKRGDRLFLRSSTGGLVSGLTEYLEWAEKTVPGASHVWLGWPGIDVEEDLRETLKSKAASKYHAVPIFIDSQTMDKFYHGFCNSTLWPLFHYFPTYAKFDAEFWEQYVRVNEAFSEAVAKVVQQDDIVWVHDYHLMLLPNLLRKKIPNISTGFFLHTPFPSYDIFRLLPTEWRRQILEGVVGADLIGFHTIDYTQHFLRCALRILGYEHSYGQFPVEDRIVKVDTFPMGIDYQLFHESAKSVEARREERGLKQKLAGLRTILSTDRLDYTKGIKNRLEAYSIFLDKYPQWRQKAVLVLSIVPSRLGAEHYQEMKEEVDRLVGNINGKFGTIDWTPIVYRYRYLPFNQLLSLFSISDVALITPLRDGMNLVAKEYLASKTDRKGVLILSEMAGAARELGEALVINPNDTNEIVEALKTALEMPEEEQIRRNEAMQDRLKRYDVFSWGQDFINKLNGVKAEQRRFNARLLDPLNREKLVKEFVISDKRVLFLDYDGTLSPFADSPEKAVPSDTLLETLKRLSEEPRTRIVIVSGRHKDTLQQWFGSLNIAMIAEHGGWVRDEGGEWRPSVPTAIGWKEKVLPVLKTYRDRLPGSFIEEKEFSLAWHYRRADPELGPMRARELADELSDFLANTELQVLQGSRIVEVRQVGVNKGSATAHFLGQASFVLAIGDDWSDEDLFKAIPDTAYSIKVGMTKSYAKFNLRSYREVIQLLKELAQNASLLQPVREPA
ncbi:bifunctional alpha,alpha-trehalose-phosphate synthase (UDP-forming)/trehalose-phosphatase [Candidatus Bathyarchaeota archaeon]|nr:MAG: bifunctional alpha,alpha-trehalose-phosphate synthase (UDP-forming)/trehalose-phosphatase [Candidatus Bathyarchaeota archaeon]